MTDPILLRPMQPLPRISASLEELGEEVENRSSHPYTQPTTTTSAPISENPSAASSAAPLQTFAALPATDTSREAHLFLLGAFFIESLVWGLPFSVGILHEYWANTLFQGRGEATITLAATLQTGLLYMSAGLFGPVFAAWPRWTLTLQIVGIIAATLSMISCAFVTEPWHLVVTIGIFYPLCGASYLPAATLLYEWYSTHRGLASGIMYSGTGLGGAIFPFLVASLLDRFGYRTTMISLGLGFAVLGGVSLIPIKRRVPLPTRTSGGGRRERDAGMDWWFLKGRIMWIGTAIILLTSLGNFVPSLWLPTFAKELSLTKPDGTGLISIMNAASVPGLPLLGALSDHLPFNLVLLTTCLGASLACLFLWGMGGTSTPPLIVFALVFGVMGLSFSALWTGMISRISRDDNKAPTLVFSVFTFTRGVGNIVSGPISQALLKSDALRGAPGAFGYRNYGVLLIYTGLTILSGGLTGLAFTDKKRNQRSA